MDAEGSVVSVLINGMSELGGLNLEIVSDKASHP